MSARRATVTCRPSLVLWASCLIPQALLGGLVLNALPVHRAGLVGNPVTVPLQFALLCLYTWLLTARITAQTEGIEFAALFRSQFVPWSDVSTWYENRETHYMNGGKAENSLQTGRRLASY